VKNKRLCPKCKQVYVTGNRYCQMCKRAYDLATKYGLSMDDFRRMIKKQGGKCAICKRRTKLVTDHCHKTGKVRGLLCSRCNTALGIFGDTLSGLRKAYDYMRRVYARRRPKQ